MTRMAWCRSLWLVALVSVPASWGALPSHLELAYVEAVLAFEVKDYPSCFHQLESILTEYPNNIKALELKALSSTAVKDYSEAADTYKQLIQLTEKKGGSPEPSYRFQLGSLEFRDKNWDSAQPHFQAALKQRFNPGACHYYLGSIALRKEVWPVAELHFSEVLKSNIRDLKPASNYFLAEIAGQRNEKQKAVKRLAMARQGAREQLSDASTPEETKQMAKRIMTSSSNTKVSLDNSALIASVALITAYDSNVLLNPSPGNFSLDGGSAPPSFKGTFNYGLGLMTPPISQVKIVPLYRGSVNYNFNANAREGQFIIQDLAVSVSTNTSDSTSLGAKLDGLATFRFTGSGYGAYSLTGLLEPFIRHEWMPSWFLGGQLSLFLHKFYEDPQTPEIYKKSGAEQAAKIYLRRNRRVGTWNPGAALNAGLRFTNGSEFRSRAYSLELNNVTHFTPQTNLSSVMALGYVDYHSRPSGGRFDTTLDWDFLLSHTFAKVWVATAEIVYSINRSNVDDPYQFRRLQVALGIERQF